MIIAPTHIDQTDTEPWMFEPCAVQEVVVRLGDGVYLRVESPQGTPTLIGGYNCETLDPSLPDSWTGSEHAHKVFVFGPSAWQEPEFWDRYSAGDEAALQIYARFRTPQPKSPSPRSPTT